MVQWRRHSWIQPSRNGQVERYTLFRVYFDILILFLVGLLIKATVSDERVFAQPYTYEAYERAAAAGDYEGATTNIRSFFEQRFSDSADSCVTIILGRV